MNRNAAAGASHVWNDCPLGIQRVLQTVIMLCIHGNISVGRLEDISALCLRRIVDTHHLGACILGEIVVP